MRSFGKGQGQLLGLLLALLSLVGLQNEHALAQTTWEFSGTSYAFQKAHFDSATKVVQTKLGVQMHTFGAPYNQIDATFLQVMSEDTNYKVLLFGQLDPLPASGQTNLKNRVYIESATGVPDYNYFLASWYSKKGTYTDYMVMQGHPYAWTTPAKLTEFQNIVNFLIATDSVVFNTPYGYYRYLTDLNIPRTNKIQVILKLDDLRATTSYFYPCLPTYDFLAANKVKASFGVNKLEALTQAQIDTLHYYMAQTTSSGDTLFEIWNHGLDHSMTSGTTGGNWSDPATWSSGYVPTSADDANIPAGVTVTIDIPDAVCNNLVIDGTLVASNIVATGLTVNGDVLINTGGSFTSPYLSGATANIIHTLSVYGDFTNAGGTFDFRTGSAGTTMRMINTTFLGSYNSTITVGTYSSSNNDFNGITVNKINGAKIICASDVVCDPGASTGKSLLTLTSGVVETGMYTIYALSTTAADIITPSSASYIVGALGRGMSNSAGKTNFFPVGDASGYRPISVTSTTAGVATGHNVVVRCVPGDANSGSSTLVGGIEVVSKVRYYDIRYNKGLSAAATTMGFNRFWPSYGPDDGVAAGNTDLRVAYSTDERATWTKIRQSLPHTTSLASPPTEIRPDTLGAPYTLTNGVGAIFVALADTIGGANALGVALQRTITASAGANGTITPDGAVTVAHGASQVFMITPAPGYRVDTLLVDGVKVDSTTRYTFLNITANHIIRAVFVASPTTTTVDVPVAGGWNLISNPVADPVSGDSVRQLYPSSLNPYVFEYSSGYQQRYRLVKGKGYWGKFAGAVSHPITGTPLTRDSLAVVAGWNIVGTISTPVDTSAIVSDPPGLRASNWFGYSNGYTAVTQLVPGKGYWIKANGPGYFILTSTPAGASGEVRNRSDEGSR
jgi:hypothetical protein